MTPPIKMPKPSKEDAEFYSRALVLAVRISRPLLMVYHVSIASLVVVALAIVIWLSLQFADRRVPVRDIETVLLTPRVKVGDKVGASWSLIRTRVCAVDITAAIIDGADELHPMVTLHRDAAGDLGPDHFTRRWEVPTDAKPGHARLRVAWAYACPGNFVQALSPLPVTFPDYGFEIVPVAGGSEDR